MNLRTSYGYLTLRINQVNVKDHSTKKFRINFAIFADHAYPWPIKRPIPLSQISRIFSSALYCDLAVTRNRGVLSERKHGVLFSAGIPPTCCCKESQNSSVLLSDNNLIPTLFTITEIPFILPKITHFRGKLDFKCSMLLSTWRGLGPSEDDENNYSCVFLPPFDCEAI